MVNHLTLITRDKDGFLAAMDATEVTLEAFLVGRAVALGLLRAGRGPLPLLRRVFNLLVDFFIVINL